MLMYLGFYFEQGGAHARSVTSWIEQGGVEHTRRHTQVTIDRGGVNTQVQGMRSNIRRILNFCICCNERATSFLLFEMEAEVRSRAGSPVLATAFVLFKQSPSVAVWLELVVILTW